MNVKVTKVGGRYAPKWSIEAAVPRKKVNGRKAWRRAAKKLRRKLREGAKARVPLVEHLPEKLAKCIAKRMRRHGTIVAADDMGTKLTTLFYVSFEEEIAGWEVEVGPRPMVNERQAGSHLIGMSSRKRKQAMLAELKSMEADGMGGIAWWLNLTGQMRVKYGVGKKLSPCPGCLRCGGKRLYLNRIWLKPKYTRVARRADIASNVLYEVNCDGRKFLATGKRGIRQ